MAKKRLSNRSTSATLDTTVIVIAIIVFFAGLAAGFFIERARYMAKIAEISKLHMEKADMINELQSKLDVLGASTHVGQ